MTTARDIIDIAARAMYTQDAQDSMSGGHWDDLDDDERHDWRRIAEAGITALRDAGLLPPDGARTLRDDLESYVNDIRRQLPYLAPGGPREMAEQIAYDLRALLDAQHTPTEETP